MRNWPDKKLDDLSHEDRIEMTNEMQILLKEFYMTSKYGSKEDVILIADTILDTFTILLFNNNDFEKELDKVKKIFISEIGEA